MRKPKTYATITAGLRKTIEELAAYEQEQEAQAQRQRQMAERLLNEAEASEAEAGKAAFTAEKLAGLLS